MGALSDWAREAWLTSDQPSVERFERGTAKFARWLSNYPIVWSDITARVAGKPMGVTRLRPRYLAELAKSLDFCEKVARKVDGEQDEDGTLMTAAEAYPVLVNGVADRLRVGDSFGVMAFRRAGIARSYKNGWNTGSIHLMLGGQLLDTRHLESARQHFLVGQLLSEREGDLEASTRGAKALARLEEVKDQVPTRLEEAEKWMNGRYRKHLPSIIHGLMLVGYFPLAQELAEESARRGLLGSKLEPFLVGALFSCARGDLDSAERWLELASQNGADSAVVDAAKSSLSDGMLQFTESVASLGFSWLGAGLPSETLTLAQQAVENDDKEACECLLSDPAVYYLPTTFPHLLTRVGRDTPDPLVRRARFNDAGAWWTDVGDEVMCALTYLNRAQAERAHGRSMSAANCSMIGLLNLEEARRRNRRSTTRRLVLGEMVTHLHEAVLDLEGRCDTAEPFGWASPPSTGYYAKVFDAMRQDAIALLVGGFGGSEKELASRLDRLAGENPPLLTQKGGAGDFDQWLKTAMQAELAMGDTSVLDLVFPDDVRDPEPNGTHQLIVDCARRPEGQTGLFGVWIRPTKPLSCAVFWGDLGDRSSRLIEAMRSPMDMGPTIPRILTDPISTNEALRELSGLLPEKLVNEIIGDGAAAITVIPTGPLWGIPWAALPIDDRPLIHFTKLRVAPSNAIAARTLSESSRSESTEITAVMDESLFGSQVPEFRDLCSIVSDRRSLDDLRRSDHGDVTLVVCHGQPLSGLAQHVTMGDQHYSAGDMLTGSKVGEVIILMACWASACRYDRSVEPVGFQTAALVRGARAVIAPQWALPLSTIGPMTVALIRHPLLLSDPAEALRGVQLEALERDPDPSTWATLACYG